MIHHISIPANEPLRVANVLAELLEAKVYPFPPCPGSYIVIPFDERGSAIEVLPAGSAHTIGKTDEGNEYTQKPAPAQYSAFHALLSVPCEVGKIKEIGAREGWHVLECSRDGLFDLVEFWVENHLMLELACPSHLQKYLNFISKDSMEKAMSQVQQRPLVNT